MGKEKTEFEEQFVSKTEKAKKLWEKRITENTALSMESVQWNESPHRNTRKVHTEITQGLDLIKEI